MMDDDRLERSLRRGPPADPPFQPSGRWLDVVADAPAREDHPRRPFQAFASLAAVAAVLVIAALIAGPLFHLREQGAGGLVAEVERRGVIRVAIDGGPPLAFGPAFGYDGFDIDVANEVARRLGVRVELVVAPRAEILQAASAGRWDVGLSFVPDAVQLGPSALRTAPYAIVRAAVAVRPEDAAVTPGDLAGESLCVVSGSVAEAWLNGQLGAGESGPPPPPARSVAVTRATLQECLTAVADAGLRAVVADRRSDLGGSGLRLLVSPPFENRLIAVVDGSTDGAGSLVSRLNQVFAEMAADGTLREYGQRRFAGEDVTPVAD